MACQAVYVFPKITFPDLEAELFRLLQLDVDEELLGTNDSSYETETATDGGIKRVTST
jgi:hypothetical protein